MSDPSLTQQAASGVTWTTAAAALSTVLNILRLVVLARLLAPEDFGLMAMVMVMVGFAQAFADMGVSNALIHRQDATRRELSSLYWLTLASGLALAVLVWAATPLVVAFYGEPRLSGLMAYAAIIFLITPIGQQFQILLQRELRFKALAGAETVAAGVGTAVAISTALLGQGVYSLVWGQLADAAVRAALTLAVGWSIWRPTWHFAARDLRGYLSFGLYQMGERSINYFNSRLDQLLIGSLIGAQALGYYAMAFNLVILPVSRINPILTRVAFPLFARVQRDGERLRRGYLKVLRYLAIVNFPLLLGLAAVAPTFVPNVFGPDWRPAIPLVQLLALVALLRSHANPVGSLLLAKGRADLGFKWNAALFFTQVPGVYLGARFGGAEGVAIALLALQLVYAIFNYRLLVAPLLGPCLGVYLRALWPPLAISAAMAAAVAALGILPGLDGLAGLALAVTLGAALYSSLTLLLLKETAGELKVLLKDRLRLRRPEVRPDVS